MSATRPAQAHELRATTTPASPWPSRLLQLAIVLAVVLGILWLFGNVIDNMRARGMQAGFGFLLEPAGFEIGESALAFDASQPFWRAFLAGLANTLRVVLPALLLATLIGFAVGIARLSPALPVRLLATAYVELFRNVPLLLQLLMWYFVLTTLLPVASEALQPLPGVFLSKSGLVLPWIADGAVSWPVLEGFGIDGGVALTPEFVAVCLGLSVGTAAFIAEAVRGGIQSVPRGQVEAARAIGLPPASVLRFIVLPQALKAIVPPLGNQYLNLLKNSSLAVAIGYPDLVSIANTSMNQTGRAFECVAVLMAVYLALSLLVAGILGSFNRRVALRGTGART